MSRLWDYVTSLKMPGVLVDFLKVWSTVRRGPAKQSEKERSDRTLQSDAVSGNLLRTRLEPEFRLFKSTRLNGYSCRGCLSLAVLSPSIVIKFWDSHEICYMTYHNRKTLCHIRACFRFSLPSSLTTNEKGGHVWFLVDLMVFDSQCVLSEFQATPNSWYSNRQWQRDRSMGLYNLFSDIDDRGFASESFAPAKDWLAQPNRVVQVIHVCTVLSSHPSLGLLSFCPSDFLYYTVDLLSNHQVTRKCQSHSLDFLSQLEFLDIDGSKALSIFGNLDLGTSNMKL